MRKSVGTFALVLGLSGTPASQPPASAGHAGAVTVHRIKTCGCCGKWMDHLRGEGFSVTEHVVDKREDAPRRSLVPELLRSCHTAEVGGYIVEGHVPANVVKDLLKKKPEILGVAVAGMPAGSPGMESDRPEPYTVVAFDAKGRTYVFASVDPAKK